MLLQCWRFAISPMNSEYCGSSSRIRFLRNSRSTKILPSAIFSSRRSFLNQLLIFVLAELVLAIFSQSRLGP